MRVMVTGGAGFLGTSLIRALRASGDEVVSVRRPRVDAHSRDGEIECDLGDSLRLRLLVETARPEAIVHLAWYARPGTYEASDENLTSLAHTLALFQLAKAAGCRRFVGAGTCMEYDWTHPRPVERLTPCVPSTLYGASKLAAFLVGERRAALDMISFAWARYGFLFGPHAPRGKLVADAIAALVAGEKFRCSSGEQVRDFQHVDDAADATVALLHSEVAGPVNIGSGAPVTVRRLIELVAAAVGGPGEPDFGALAGRPGDPLLFVPDLARLTKEVGWHPAATLEERIASTVAHARSTE